MATHSIILAWKIPQPEDPGWVYSPWGRKTSAVTEHSGINASSILRPFPFCLTGTCFSAYRFGSHLVTTGKIYLLRGVETKRRKQSP